MKILRHLPNLLTSANLFIGCLALIEIFEGRLENVIYYVLASGLMDFLDGFAARLTKSSSNIGKDLDSLADMVSFSVVPAFLMFQMSKAIDPTSPLIYVTLFVAVFSALRLAKFNNDTRQTDHFHGLPVPANAFFICALPVLVEASFLTSLLTNLYFLVALSLVMSLLLVSDFKLIALKFKGYRWKGNESKYVLIVLSAVAIATYQIIALPFIIIFYVLLSIITNILSPNKA